MPWTPNDGPQRHSKKVHSAKDKRQWSDAANSARVRALAEGKSAQEADAIGVRVGNAAVKKTHARHRAGR